jgi:hypothetical protein
VAVTFGASAAAEKKAKKETAIEESPSPPFPIVLFAQRKFGGNSVK